MDNTVFHLSVLWLMGLWNVYMCFSVNICVQVFVWTRVFCPLGVRIGEDYWVALTYVWPRFYGVSFGLCLSELCL